jgi:hypothetical protein
MHRKQLVRINTPPCHPLRFFNGILRLISLLLHDRLRTVVTCRLIFRALILKQDHGVVACVRAMFFCFLCFDK